jgi:hypothetical protein
MVIRGISVEAFRERYSSFVPEESREFVGECWLLKCSRCKHDGSEFLAIDAKPLSSPTSQNFFQT